LSRHLKLYICCNFVYSAKKSLKFYICLFGKKEAFSSLKLKTNCSTLKPANQQTLVDLHVRMALQFFITILAIRSASLDPCKTNHSASLDPRNSHLHFLAASSGTCQARRVHFLAAAGAASQAHPHGHTQAPIGRRPHQRPTGRCAPTPPQKSTRAFCRTARGEEEQDRAGLPQ
jgi:hypothetical protein